MNLWSLPSAKVTSQTFGSIISATGNKARTAIGDIYSSKFIEFNFSLPTINRQQAYNFVTQRGKIQLDELTKFRRRNRIFMMQQKQPP